MIGSMSNILNVFTCGDDTFCDFDCFYWLFPGKRSAHNQNYYAGSTKRQSSKRNLIRPSEMHLKTIVTLEPTNSMDLHKEAKKKKDGAFPKLRTWKRNKKGSQKEIRLLLFQWKWKRAMTFQKIAFFGSRPSSYRFFSIQTCLPMYTTRAGAARPLVFSAGLATLAFSPLSALFQ